MGRMDDELDAEFPEEGKRFDAAMDRILNPDDYVKPENLQVGTPRPDTQAAPASDWCSCDEGLVRDCPIHGEWPNPALTQPAQASGEGPAHTCDLTYRSPDCPACMDMSPASGKGGTR